MGFRLCSCPNRSVVDVAVGGLPTCEKVPLRVGPIVEPADAAADDDPLVAGQIVRATKPRRGGKCRPGVVVVVVRRLSLDRDAVQQIAGPRHALPDERRASGTEELAGRAGSSPAGCCRCTGSRAAQPVV